MYYMDDEDYFEPGEFDEKIEELKNELREHVKKEIKDELEKLREENEKLQGIKENFESIKEDYERKKAECDRAAQSAEYKAKRAKLKELMEQFKITMWSVDWDYLYKKKCNKCDESRRIKVVLPSGKTVDDDCKCDIHKKIYHPQEERLYKLSDKYGRTGAWYKLSSSSEDGDDFTYSTGVKTIVDHNKDFEEIKNVERLKGVFFTTKEECQKFCDYINGTETEGYDYDMKGQMIAWRYSLWLRTQMSLKNAEVQILNNGGNDENRT